MSPRQRRAIIAAGRAFSLIEILIAVLVLGIGLLGIGAVFPVIVRQQRIGTERIEGVIAVNDAVAEARLLTGLFDPLSGGGFVRDQLIREWWLEEIGANEGSVVIDLTPGDLAPNIASSYEEGRWFTKRELVEAATGTMIIPPGAAIAEIPVSERLYPKGQTPAYVWDLAVKPIRAVTNNTTLDDDVVKRSIINNDRILVAVFIRRLDPGLRVGDLVNVGNPGEPHPVAVDDDGIPTRNGLGNYAALRTIDADVDVITPPNGAPAIRNRIEFPRIIDEDWGLVSRIGQKLIDNFGTVYTVVGESTSVGGTRGVKVDPPVPTFITDDDEIEGLFVEVLFSPQIPAAVTTYEVTP